MKRRQLLRALALAPATAMAQALPPPRHGLPGLLRISGTPGLAPVIAAWVRAYAALRPDLRVAHVLPGSDVAMASLYTAGCDIALLGREATRPEIQAFEWIHRYRPRGLPVLTGSVATPGCSPAIAVMVHPANPLASLRLDHLRAAFGDEAPRARTWGDLGLDGAWQARPINLYAPDAESGTGRFFRARVLNGSNRMAWARLREFAVPPRPAEAEAQVAAALRRALSRDPGGLAIGTAGKEAGTRLVPLAGADGLARLPDAQSVGSGQYPLARGVHAYLAHPPAGMADGGGLEFLRFILSEQGQGIAASAGDYLPLTAAAATQSREALAWRVQNSTMA